MNTEKSLGISVIIPCLNEEGSIGLVVNDAIRGIKAAGLPGEVLVVDNGSSDRSAEIARLAGASVIHETIRGYGAAIQRGFAEALYSILVMGDGDQTYDMMDIPRLIEPIKQGEADLVMGNRMKSIRPGAMPWLHRHVGNPLLSLLVRVMFHNNAVHDVHCGLRAISKEAHATLRCVTTGMEFASEMVVRAFHQRLRIREINIIYHPRVGDSKLRAFKDGWRHLRFMILHSPATMLLFPGLLFWGVGLIVVASLLFGPIVLNERRIDIHSMIMGGLMNVVGLQVVTMGLLAKAYAHLSGMRVDPVVEWFYRHVTFERATLAALLILLVGGLIAGRVILDWIRQGFGALDAGRALVFALMCIINGVQVGSAAYLFSIMALPRHVDTMPKQARGTGIRDV